MKKHFLLPLCLLLVLTSCAQVDKPVSEESEQKFNVTKTVDEWKTELTESEFNILREQGTERPFTGDLLKNTKDGVYTCRGCGVPLYDSKTKFKSGTGWPSFFDAIKGNVGEVVDNSHGMRRVEIICTSCGGHLGHIFSDGPEPTGQRHCVNSASLDFEER